MALQNLALVLTSVLRGAGFNEARKALSGLDSTFKEVALSAGKAAINFAAAGTIKNLTQYIDEAVIVTQKYERNILALNQTFEDQAGAMRQFTKDAVNIGVSQSQAAQASVFLGSVLKQYGLETSVSSQETQKLIGLSQDLATTYGYDLQEALLAMTALFRGEYDPIEKFGVAMKQNEINALLAERGQSKLTGTMLFQAQVQARLDLLYQRSADSMGAFSRATDTLYVAQSKLNAVIENQQIAFGEPLQKPLTDLTNIFAKVVEEVTPAVRAFGELLASIGNLITPLVDLGAKVQTVLVQGLGNAVEGVNQFFATWAATLESVNYQLELLAQNSPFLQGIFDSLNADKKDSRLIEFFNYLNEQMERNEQNARAITGNFEGFDNGAKRVATSVRGAYYAQRALNEATAAALEKGTAFENMLRGIGTEADITSGKTSTMTQVFSEIDDAIAQSNAKESLEGLGLSAGLIERVLTDPNWEEIFGKISRLAKLTAIDIAMIPSVTAAAGYSNEIAKLREELSNLFTVDVKKPTAANAKAVETIFDSLSEATSKQRARLQLGAKGASTGLIDLILGRSDWMSLWTQIKQGVISLKDLQTQFNKTADGVKELESALQDAADEAQAHIEEMQALADEAKKVWDDAIKSADEYKKSIAELAMINILPTLEPELGRFESQIISAFEKIRAKLSEGLDSGTIYQAGYDELLAYANREAELLASIGRQRDDLAKRSSLTEGLIEEYRSALTASLSLTSLFSSLKSETEKRTITEVSNSVMTLSGSLKEFNVTVSKSYEETIDKVIDKSAGLLTGFRDMAAKARAFADNLRTLRDMNLDPMLFNQLVQAGVEAGGETAQALVDGGSDTIKEINGLFDEINTLGMNLGLETAATLYDTGIDMADGLLAGLASKQTELETLAKSMAQAFNDNFNAKVSTQTAIPVKAAEDAYQAAAVAVPTMKQIDVQALADLNKLIAGANSYIGNVSGALSTGGTNKLSIYEALKADVLSGAQLDLSGIKSGMSTGDLAAAAKASGSTTVNNITVQVKTDATQSNAMVGKQIGNAITSYVQTGGQVLVQ